MKKKGITIVLNLVFVTVLAQNPVYVTFQKSTENFALVENNKALPVLFDTTEPKSVKLAIENFYKDIEKVTGVKRDPFEKLKKSDKKRIIIVGTVGQSKLLASLAKRNTISLTTLQGSWEKFETQIINNPLPGIDQALIIAGSDARGAIYGLYHIAEQMGVSPWHYWADVPVKPHKNIYVEPGIYTLGEPKVKYRGIFLNDEAPCLSGWSHEKHGGFNASMYATVFDLMLRLRANYIWPAMWGNAFFADDPKNAELARDMGIVIGTSHHEPLARAHDEWRRYGKKGPWDYTKNDSTLRAFWQESIEKRHQYEQIVTVGMRGDGDEPMTRETATGLLEKIVTDQRNIIEKVTKKPANQTPQLWALYKEVQDYYDKGMRVPDDVTLLLCDDNWGNIRKLPNLEAKPRKGGYGIYYHFDYVGGPRNYKWLNTNHLPRVWEQMHLAYQYKVRDIWIVNVGDLKPMELPISFFLDYAWNPENIPLEQLSTYTKQWSDKTFGSQFASEIATYLNRYSKYMARIKPELLNANIYSLDSHNDEWLQVVSEFKDLEAKALITYQKIDNIYKDAYYQLVLYPILAGANLYEMYYAHAKNQQAAKAKWTSTNAWADKVEELFKKDQDLSDYFNKTLANGKWNHFADQTHIGYTYWQQPPKNTVPKVTRLESNESMVPVPIAETMVENIDHQVDIKGFIEQYGYVSMEASNFSKAINNKDIQWKIIPDIGKTGDGITIFPVNISSIPLTADSPYLQYDVYLSTAGEAKIKLICSPTLAFNENKGLKLAVSINNEIPQIINMHADQSEREWNRTVAQNAKILSIPYTFKEKGKHALKVWAIDPAIVLQKIVIDLGGEPKTYLGAPESKRVN